MKRMSYATYAYLRGLLEKEQKSLENDFRTACCFIPSESGNFENSGIAKAHKIFQQQSRALSVMQEELHDAAAISNVNRPDCTQAMREFWGITT